MFNCVKKKIDSLGRIVIPSYCRDAILAKKGDYVDIFAKNGEIIIKKSDENNRNMHFYDKICEILFKYLGGTCMIIKNEVVISSYGNKQGKYHKGLKINFAKIVKKSNFLTLFDIEIENEFKNKDTDFVMQNAYEENKTAIIALFDRKMIESDTLLLSSYGKLIGEVERMDL